MGIWFSRERHLPATDAETWVVRMHARRLDGGERRALRRWLATSPFHARDFLRAETAWRLSGALAREPEVQLEMMALAALPRPDEGAAPARGRIARRWAAVAAVLLVLSVAAGRWLAAGPTWYVTAHGEQRMITLCDGSVVSVNTDSRIGVAYSDAERRIELVSGEALFEVAPNARRPFIVHTGSGFVRAVGTRFDVVRAPDRITVKVLQGTVEVAPGSKRGSVRARLRDGEAIAFGPGGAWQVARATVASGDRISAWREGKLRFDGWTLQQAIEEHNRYAPKPIRLEAGFSTQIRVSGVFRIGDTSAFLRALHDLLAIEVVDTGNVLLVKSEPANPSSP